MLSYRTLIWQQALADMRHRYAGTNLGMFWNVLHPLAMITVYSVVFSSVMKPRLPGVSEAFAYTFYLCSGFLPWLAFSECVTRGTNAFTENAAYLRKLPIPEPVFVAQAAVSATMGLGISFSLLLVISLALGHRPTVWWLLLPVPLVALQAVGFGIGLLCATLNVFLRDIGQMMYVLLQVVMWTAPVVYLADVLPGWAKHLLLWHPLVPALVLTRDLFVYDHHTPPAAMAATPLLWIALFAWPTLILTVAAFVFRRLRKEIRDVL